MADVSVCLSDGCATCDGWVDGTYNIIQYTYNIHTTYIHIVHIAHVPK